MKNVYFFVQFCFVGLKNTFKDVNSFSNNGGVLRQIDYQTFTVYIIYPILGPVSPPSGDT